MHIEFLLAYGIIQLFTFGFFLGNDSVKVKGEIKQFFVAFAGSLFWPFTWGIAIGKIIAGKKQDE